jgi:hypothetical protein
MGAKINASLYNAVPLAELLIKELVKEVAKQAIELMVMISPVWTGSYVSSHRIGFNQENASGPTYINQEVLPGRMFSEKLSSGEAIALGKQVEAKLLAEVERMFAQDDLKIRSLIFTNKIGHADSVEIKHAVYAGVANHLRTFAKEASVEAKAEFNLKKVFYIRNKYNQGETE